MAREERNYDKVKEWGGAP